MMLLVAHLEEELRVAREQQPPAITEAQRSQIFELATDLPRLWNQPSSSAATRKRILGEVLEEIIVTVEADRLLLKLHWKGGDHTALQVSKKPRWTNSLDNQCRNRTVDPRSRTAGAIIVFRRSVTVVYPARGDCHKMPTVIYDEQGSK
jgi:hypothetical protein